MAVIALFALRAQGVDPDEVGLSWSWLPYSLDVVW